VSPDLVPGLVREGLLLLASVGGPLFAVLLVAGLALGVLQSATQIQDPAVGFLPRAAAGVLVCWLAGPWMAERLAHFLAEAIARMGMR
jgi:flagellar biosynthesis protein FliQ